MTSVPVECAPFSCNNRGEGEPYCGVGQVCLRYSWPYPSTLGSIYECVDNPCPAGVVDVRCMQESVCRGTVGIVTQSAPNGHYVSCQL